MSKESSPLHRPISRDQAKDVGMALALVCLLIAYYGKNQAFAMLAGLLLVLDMVWPTVFRIPAKMWFGLAQLMGAVMSRVILSVLFYGLVTPIGVLRRMGGADLMQRKQWRKSKVSVFKTRDHTFQAQDIEQPY